MKSGHENCVNIALEITFIPHPTQRWTAGRLYDRNAYSAIRHNAARSRSSCDNKKIYTDHMHTDELQLFLTMIDFLPNEARTNFTGAGLAQH